MIHTTTTRRALFAALFLFSFQAPGAFGMELAPVGGDGATATAAPSAALSGALAPLLDGLGDHHFEITTNDPMASRFFDQGLVLAYAFNHEEALRAFRESARIDPACAMCQWGIAWVQGSNINMPMNPDNAPDAYAAMRRAEALAATASPRERAFVAALSSRYVEDPPVDRSELDASFAEGMRRVVEKFPQDLDGWTLFAESLMLTTPWDYWLPNGDPRAVTVEILDALERVMAEDPSHPGANHFYIHAVEARHPYLGVAAAERLGQIAPGAGHLVHMPSHIFIRTGRYHEASQANQDAIDADLQYLTQCRQQGFYDVSYMPHNRHFLWAAASIEGRREVATRAAEELAGHMDAEALRTEGMGFTQHFLVSPTYSRVRFGRWDEILSLPEPEEDLIYPRAIWRFARGMAHVRGGDLAAAADELAALESLADSPVLEEVTVWDLNTTADLVRVGYYVLSGELAAASGDLEGARENLQTALEYEDLLTYDEPSAWPLPVRLYLGALLLEMGQPADAEQIYRENLEVYPDNGWGLVGLIRSLEAQDLDDLLPSSQARLQRAWRHADTDLSHSRF